MDLFQASIHLLDSSDHDPGYLPSHSTPKELQQLRRDSGQWWLEWNCEVLHIIKKAHTNSYIDKKEQNPLKSPASPHIRIVLFILFNSASAGE